MKDQAENEKFQKYILHIKAPNGEKRKLNKVMIGWRKPILLFKSDSTQNISQERQRPSLLYWAFFFSP